MNLAAMMNIAVMVSPDAHVERQFETGLDADDIVKLAGYALIKDREALRTPNVWV